MSIWFYVIFGLCAYMLGIGIKEVWDLMWLKEISTNYKTSGVSRFVTPHKKVSSGLWDW